MRKLYAGCDLHSNNNLIGIIDGEGKRVFKRKLLNNLSLVRETLKPFQKELVGIVVESTYNWYWMVDGLMEKGYRVHLANPSAIQQYAGLKHAVSRFDPGLVSPRGLNPSLTVVITPQFQFFIAISHGPIVAGTLWPILFPIRRRIKQEVLARRGRMGILRPELLLIAPEVPPAAAAGPSGPFPGTGPRGCVGHRDQLSYASKRYRYTGGNIHPSPASGLTGQCEVDRFHVLLGVGPGVDPVEDEPDVLRRPHPAEGKVV